MISGRVARSLAEIDRSHWNALYPGEIEDYDYLRAVEAAGLPGFMWRYALVEERGRLIAAAPGFITSYSLDTTLGNVGRALTHEIRRLLPGALTIRLACLGSPCTETTLFGFSPDLTHEARGAALRMLISAFEKDAAQAHAGLVAIKDTPETLAPILRTIAKPLGYFALPGMPSAYLDIDFANIEEYISHLSAETRKDMRRKLRSRTHIRLEWHPDISRHLEQITALYNATLARADMKFEELTPEYFQGTLHNKPNQSICALYYFADELLAFNLLLHDSHTLLDKYFCMDERGRVHNLYFLSWFANIEFCLAHGLKRYQSGQAAYENKLRLKSRLMRTQMFARHRNPAINAALRIAAPLLSGDPVGSMHLKTSTARGADQSPERNSAPGSQ